MDEEVVTTWTHLSMTGKNRRDGKDFQRGPKMNLKKKSFVHFSNFFLCTHTSLYEIRKKTTN